ncbi:hypothetical protein [Thalassolituus oleivorans]|uniref:hypothetical protein n=1 Tax=Thalassolituus oleivorans TaxID=187493 RepID=UPI0023F05F4A|nr:hypothetical protein [Thalassolituus oleivorans]
MLTSADGFGPRLKSARKAKGFSARWIVNYINGYIVSKGYPPLTLNTYYAWERIGTPLEVKKGRRWPHIIEHKLLLIPLGITGYWLFNGDMGGKIIRNRADLPALNSINYGLEQHAAIINGDRLRSEFNRLIEKIDDRRRSALLNLFKMF